MSHSEAPCDWKPAGPSRRGPVLPEFPLSKPKACGKPCTRAYRRSPKFTNVMDITILRRCENHKIIGTTSAYEIVEISPDEADVFEVMIS